MCLKPDYYDKLSPALKEIYNIDGIDVGFALKRLAGKQRIFEMSARTAGGSMEERISQLEKHLENNMTEKFAFDMHSLKGSLGNIGAISRAEAAELLEKAAKDGNAEYLKSSFHSFAADIKDLGRRLCDIFEK